MISIKQILSWGPCEKYSSEELLLFVSGGRCEMKLLDILNLDIPTEDRIWVGLHALPMPFLIEYSCDCAWHVVSIYEHQFPGDSRPRDAVRVARMYNNGLISLAELDAAWEAARDAAWAAVRDAAWDAARDDRDAACEACAAARADRDAEWEAAWAARDAAWAAESEWQIERLKHYAMMEV